MHLHQINDSPYLVARYNWIEAAITAAGAIGSAIGNGISTYKNNMKQEAWTREQFDYNKQLNQQIMEREDTAYQRAVADAKAAGLSPLTVAGTGGAGSGGSVSQSNLGMNTEAFQIEPNTLADAMRALQQESMQERQIDADSKSQESQQDFEMKKQAAALDAQDKMLDKQLEATAKIEDKKLKEQELRRIQDKKIFNATQRNIFEAKNQETRMAASAEAKKAAAAIGVKNFEPFTDWTKYQEALKTRSVGAQTRANDSWNMTQGYDETTTNGGSRSVGASLGAHGSAASYGSATSDVGASASLSGSESGNSSQTMHSSAVQQMNQAESSYWNKVGYPVYVGEHHHSDI